jgi:1-deoxy-D-xylulose-5-phosphate synthase
MVATAAAHDSGPIAFRFPRGEGVGVELPDEGVPLPIGKGRIVREGGDVQAKGHGRTAAILSYGARLAECLAAADILAAKGISVTVADARFAKPLDEELALRLAREHDALITVEEGSIGGFGSYVLHCLAANGALDQGVAVRTLTLPDIYQDHDSHARMLAQAGLDAHSIAGTVEALLSPAARLPRRA